jgi:excisionase family DNA binding protein
MADNDVTLDAVIDVLAEKLATRVRLDLAQNGGVAVKPRLFSVEEGAVYLGRSKEAVEHMIGAGKLPVVRADRRVFLDVRDLDRWIEANKI